MRHLITASLIVLSVAGLALRADDPPAPNISIAGLYSANPTTVQRTTAQLRQAGPAGLRALLEESERNPGMVRAAMIDAVAGQKDASWSKLYWYTDLEAAKTQAKEQKKPILYLRMLGKLTDEYSCANSRFFRTVLYANENVSNLLREKFVLVWGSERPVPVITVDYGDGRVLKRTITGNSAHYVLDAQGNVVDAIPGLYDPVAFARIASAAADAASTGTAESRRTYWAQSQAMLASEWGRDTLAPAVAPANAGPSRPTAVDAMPRSMSKTGVERPLVQALVPQPPAAPGPLGANGAAVKPTAIDAMPRSRSKTEIEVPLVVAVVPPSPAIESGGGKSRRGVPNAAEAGEQALGKRVVEGPMLKRLSRDFAQVIDARGASDATWEEITRRHLADAHLDANSVALIRSQNPAAYTDEAALARVVEQFERSVAADTVRNNYIFRAEILRWLAASTEPMQLEALNERVYSELFLTPRTDPWLGLVPESTYTGLTGDGCIVR